MPAKDAPSDTPFPPAPRRRFRLGVPPSVLGLAGLGIGMGLGALFPEQLRFIGAGVLWVFAGIADLAPYLIFLTLTPALGGMLRTGAAAKFAAWVLVAMLASTFLAAFYGILVAVPVLGVPLGATGSVAESLRQIGVQMGDLAFTSRPFIAIWYSLLVALFLFYGERWRGLEWFCRPTARTLHQVGVVGVEKLGRVIVALFPFILFAIGVFVPTIAAEAVAQTREATDVAQYQVWGSTNPIVWYLFTVVLVAVAGFVWVLGVGYVVCRYTRFPYRRFFSEYFVYVYGVSWATASSTASIPVNLERTRTALDARSEVRDFIIPLGATVNLDGTMMAGFFIMPIAGYLVGYQVTMLDMLLVLLPLVVVSIGVPGIPGGMAAIAPPVILAIVPGIPEPATFMAIFAALAVGLTDNFRTGVNTCDNGLMCRLFEYWYPRHFTRLGAVQAEIAAST